MDRILKFVTWTSSSGVSLLILAVVRGYHGYVVFSWLYGISLGGYLYSLKMLALEQIKGRHFTRSWSFIQGAKSVPMLVGIPVTGYLNEYYPKSGYYFSFVTTVIGATLLFLIGKPKDQLNCNKNLQTHRIPNFNECICTLPLNYVTCVPEVHPFGFFKPSTSYCDNFLTHNGDFYRGSCGTLPPKPVPKSMSCAANIDRSPINYPMKYCDYLKMTKMRNREFLRLSKSVPEGLARLECRSPYYRRPVRNVQVIEQITTSV